MSYLRKIKEETFFTAFRFLYSNTSASTLQKVEQYKSKNALLSAYLLALFLQPCPFGQTFNVSIFFFSFFVSNADKNLFFFLHELDLLE